MSAGGSACGVASSFGRRTCNACAYAPRNRTGKDAGAGKTTTASEKPCTALIVVSGAVARSPGEAAPSHREPLDVNQTDSARNGRSYPCDLAFNGCRWHPLSFVRLRERSGRLGRRSPHCRPLGYGQHPARSVAARMPAGKEQQTRSLAGLPAKGLALLWLGRQHPQGISTA